MKEFLIFWGLSCFILNFIVLISLLSVAFITWNLKIFYDIDYLFIMRILSLGSVIMSICTLKSLKYGRKY